MVESKKLQNYLKNQQVPFSLIPILRAMVAEMSLYATPEDLRYFFSKTGARFAQDVKPQFEGLQTLDELEEHLNKFWSQINWGWVELKEIKSFIHITHQAAPLLDAFGSDAYDSSIGLLEGFYQSVFQVLGASDTMTVRAVIESNDAMRIQMRFGQQEK